MADLSKFSIDPKEVETHSFFPLIGYEKTTRKIDFDVFPPQAKVKERKIRYASHYDSAIYSIYAQKLNVAYERCLGEYSLGDVVLAYRSGIGYNVPFAKALIDEIKSRGTCRVICMDLSKFFDRIPHKILKFQLCKVLGVKRVPNDWFKIFERITKFEYVMTVDIKRKLGKIVGPKICEIDVFRDVIRPLVNHNIDESGVRLNFGIPQGTPLSGLFANLVMLEFDHSMKLKASAFGGSYRRYSDDIAIVLPDDSHEAELLCFANETLKDYGLSFNNEKTCKTSFVVTQNGQQYSGDLLQYLGFTYDGQKLLIRPESIKNYYARMKRNIRRYIKSAAKRGLPIRELRKRVLIGRFTHWGDSRNFVQYAYRAAEEMHAPEIKRQLRNHVNIFNNQWNRICSEILS